MSKTNGDDRRAVERANRAFYEAFEARDLDALSAMSVRDARASCVHPGWEALRGWEAVRTAWETIFRNTEWMRFTLEDVEIVTSGTLAVVRLTEGLESLAGGRSVGGRLAATNVFLRGDEGWLLLHHHASPMLDDGDDDEDEEEEEPAAPDEPPTLH